MKAVTFRQRGNFNKTEKWMNALTGKRYMNDLDRLAQMGVEALSMSTPVKTGETAASWGYEITRNDDETIITWTNSNINDGVNIAIILQYGHGTGTGGYVQGYDYINPAMKPIFDSIAENVWRGVTST